MHELHNQNVFIGKFLSISGVNNCGVLYAVKAKKVDQISLIFAIV